MKLGVAVMCKDESAIIERCLESIILIADEVIITDTGSTDDTIIRAGLFLQKNNIKFKIYSEKFVDFGYNRTLLLQRARQSDVDYVLMLDADEILVKDNIFDYGNFKSGLRGYGYNLLLQSGDTHYFLPRLLSNRGEWKFIGVTHEYLSTQGCLLASLKQPTILQINDGSRRQKNLKFSQDIELLQKTLAETPTNPDTPRYTFYLAQSYYGLKQYQSAMEYYLKRTLMGHWQEEIFYSFYQLGNIYAQTTTNLNQVMRYYMLAIETCPWRAEPLAALRKFLLEHKYITLDNPCFKTQLTLPKDGLFLESNKYEPPFFFNG